MIEILYLVFLFLAAVAAGLINTIAGGGTLITFPSLVRFGRLSEVMANATNTVALVPGSLAGAWGFRRELQGTRPWLLLLLGPSCLGGIVGSFLLTRLPEQYFAALVPWLLLSASLLFLVQPYLSKLLPKTSADSLPGPALCVGVVLFQFVVAIYGGYFGAGIGILMLTALGLMGMGDIHKMNAIKTILGSVINGVSVVVFVIDDKIYWPSALLMSVGAIVGGYAGAHFGRRLPRVVVRWFVIMVGLTLAGYYFARQGGLLATVF